MRGRIFGCLIFLILTSIAQGEDRKLPTEITVDCSGSQASSYVWHSDEFPVGTPSYRLSVSDEQFDKDKEQIILNRVEDTQDWAYSIPTWKGTRTIKLGHDMSVMVSITFFEKERLGDFLKDNPNAYLEIHVLKGTKKLAVLSDFFDVEKNTKQISLRSMSIRHTELENFLSDKKTSIDEYLGIHYFSQSLSLEEQRLRAKELYQGFGDGNGLVENVRIGCTLNVPWTFESGADSI